jgi:hypothetical protein
MDRGGGDQGPIGSDTGNDQRMATNPDELARKEASDPNQTAGDDAESGAGYGNHAMPDVVADEGQD